MHMHAEYRVAQVGRVLLDGMPIGQLNTEWFHRQVALVGQVRPL